MKEYYKEDNPSCYFHPKEETVGVCPLCLNDRLLILAAKQGRHLPKFSLITNKQKKKHPITLPKIFALGSLRNRFEFQRKEKFHDCDYTDASASLEDSFISIKFEDSGVGLWEKSDVPKVSLDHCSNISGNGNKEITKSVVEHRKPRSSLRWRKRIGHLFQVSRWRRSSSNGSVCHVGRKLEGMKGKSWWIRAMTKRTKE